VAIVSIISIIVIVVDILNVGLGPAGTPRKLFGKEKKLKTVKTRTIRS
jgi:hypothetical protein